MLEKKVINAEIEASKKLDYFDFIDSLSTGAIIPFTVTSGDIKNKDGELIYDLGPLQDKIEIVITAVNLKKGTRHFYFAGSCLIGESNYIVHGVYFSGQITVKQLHLYYPNNIYL